MFLEKAKLQHVQLAIQKQLPGIILRLTRAQNSVFSSDDFRKSWYACTRPVRAQCRIDGKARNLSDSRCNRKRYPQGQTMKSQALCTKISLRILARKLRWPKPFGQVSQTALVSQIRLDDRAGPSMVRFHPRRTDSFQKVFARGKATRLPGIRKSYLTGT